MASQAKSDAARANGAKSKGPATPQGKARSSQNALKHGLTATFTVLPGESQEDFEALLEDHLTLYQPAGAVEQDLVHTLAQLRWRLRRIPTLEYNVLDNETILREEEIDDDFSEIDDAGRLGFAFKKLADKSQVLSLLIRYESSLTRLHDRTYKHLQKLRNEPKPPVTPPNPDPPAVPAPCVSVRVPSRTQHPQPQHRWRRRFRLPHPCVGIPAACTPSYFSSDLNTSIAFSICRSRPVRKSAGVLSTTTSGGTP